MPNPNTFRKKRIQKAMSPLQNWIPIQDESGYTHQFYSQYYRGIKVEGGEFSVHAKDGNIETVFGDFHPVEDVVIEPKLSENGGALLSYVHYGNGHNNAFWSPQDRRMTYGDGLLSPLTTLDICAHEIGHGICQSTANLTYQGESGAINLSFG